VDIILSWLSEEDKESIRAMQEGEIIRLHFTLGLRIRNQLGLWGKNPDLVAALSRDAPFAHPDDLYGAD